MREGWSEAEKEAGKKDLRLRFDTVVRDGKPEAS